MRQRASAALLCSIWALAWLLLGSRADAAPGVHGDELNLAVGENRTLSAADVKNYSEGVPGIVEVKLTPGGSQFVVVGIKPGATTLLLIHKDGSELTWHINVFARPVQTVRSELDQLLGDLIGVRVRQVGARFFIEGGVSSQEELKRIEHIAGLYEGQVESLVVLGGAAADRRINIRIDVFFVQYDKTKNQRIGINWPGSFGGEGVIGSAFAYDFLAKQAVTARASVVNQPLPSLDMAARNGWAKVLKHATVITSNGAEATFSSGGAQNYQVVSGLTASIEKIRFGADIKVLPRFDVLTRQMAINVGAEMTDLTPAMTGTVLPGQNISKLATVVALKLGQSLVLSGIDARSYRHNRSGLPWLSQIPIIGALFGTVTDENENVEGAIFVVPSVVENIPQHTSELIDRAVAQFGGYDGDLEKVAPLELMSRQQGRAAPSKPQEKKP